MATTRKTLVLTVPLSSTVAFGGIIVVPGFVAFAGPTLRRSGGGHM